MKTTVMTSAAHLFPHKALLALATFVLAQLSISCVDPGRKAAPTHQGEQVIFVATIAGYDVELLNAIAEELEAHNIEFDMGGSVVYGISVSPADAARARTILRSSSRIARHEWFSIEEDDLSPDHPKEE